MQLKTCTDKAGPHIFVSCEHSRENLIHANCHRNLCEYPEVVAEGGAVAAEAATATRQSKQLVCQPTEATLRVTAIYHCY